MSAERPVLEVHDLNVSLNGVRGRVQILNCVSFSVKAGETLAILGESGSGKSVTGLALMGLLPIGAVTGSILFDGAELIGSSAEIWRDLRGTGIGMVFQDPLSALNPSRRIGDQISEGLRRRLGFSRRACRAAAAELLAQVGIADASRRIDDYPHQFSGGMRQRAMIAMALAMHPKLVIADEPTTALDVTVQAQIMQLLLDLQKETGMALILITHDLCAAASAANNAAVMYAGRIVEAGSLRQVFEHPAHPYTRGLLAAVPEIERRLDRMAAIAGSPPDFAELPDGCSYRPRCPMAAPLCAKRPALRPVEALSHSAACHFAEKATA